MFRFNDVRTEISVKFLVRRRPGSRPGRSWAASGSRDRFPSITRAGALRVAYREESDSQDNWDACYEAYVGSKDKVYAILFQGVFNYCLGDY